MMREGDVAKAAGSNAMAECRTDARSGAWRTQKKFSPRGPLKLLASTKWEEGQRLPGASCCSWEITAPVAPSNLVCLQIIDEADCNAMLPCYVLVCRLVLSIKLSFTIDWDQSPFKNNFCKNSYAITFSCPGFLSIRVPANTCANALADRYQKSLKVVHGPINIHA